MHFFLTWSFITTWCPPVLHPLLTSWLHTSVGRRSTALSRWPAWSFQPWFCPVSPVSAGSDPARSPLGKELHRRSRDMKLLVFISSVQYAWVCLAFRHFHYRRLWMVPGEYFSILFSVWVGGGGGVIWHTYTPPSWFYYKCSDKTVLLQWKGQMVTTSPTSSTTANCGILCSQPAEVQPVYVGQFKPYRSKAGTRIWTVFSDIGLGSLCPCGIRRNKELMFLCREPEMVQNDSWMPPCGYYLVILHQ